MAVSLAIVHHANQFLITNGYENREGISDIVGSKSSRIGILGVLAVHAELKVALNLHLSGTLLEAIAWHCPEAINELRRHLATGLVELVGSCYGQNIMRFFSADYNLQQLNEQLRLYESLLGVDPATVKVFWPPERVWETRRMAPVLRDASLRNGGYTDVILDDRTLLSPRDSDLPRATFDANSPWTPELCMSHQIGGGLGLVALPIATRLRRSIPPKEDEDWNRVERELEELAVHAANAGENNVLALYADDMEKVIGVWGADGPPLYTAFLRWILDNQWVEPVKISDWTRNNPPVNRRAVETGTFVELAREFNAGEGYENWFYSEQWAPYREYFESTARRVKECKKGEVDSSLIELAEKQLLVSNWETAWHTPATGAHGDAEENGKPSPWAKALTSHCRHALVTVEAACWAKLRDGLAHATMRDVDNDGEPDLVIQTDRVFGLISPRWGGRLVSLFHLGGSRGAMVIGNPCDDWNFLEDLNRFMHAPRNHPGAFADVGFEDDQYSCEIFDHAGAVTVRLTNIQEDSLAKGMLKVFRFPSSSEEFTVEYSLPGALRHLSVECAFSPDYLSLLRRGSKIMKPLESHPGFRGFEASGLAVGLNIDDGLQWEHSDQTWIGHGRTVRVGGDLRRFRLSLRVSERECFQGAA